jgi:hypothetical protein
MELGLFGALIGAGLLVVLGIAAGAAPHAPAAAGVLAAAFVTGMLSFGAWQTWWVASQLLALVALAGLRRRGA